MGKQRWRWSYEDDGGRHHGIYLAQQYANLPQHGLVVTVQQRTTGSGRSVLLKPESVRALRDALTEWLEQEAQR